MSSNTWRTDDDIAPDSPTLWGGAEEFCFQPSKSEAVQGGAEEVSFQPIKCEAVQGGAEEFSFQQIKSEAIMGGVNCPFSFMPLADSPSSLISLQENAANYFGYNYADNSNIMASSTLANNALVNPFANSFISTTQANNTHMNPFADSFSPVSTSSNVNISQNYLGLKESQSLDLNSPPVNLPGMGYDLLAVKTEIGGSIQEMCLANEPSSSTLELGHGYDNWMMYDAYQPYTTMTSNGRFLSIGNADYRDPVPVSSSYQESLIRDELIQPTCQELATTPNNVVGSDFVGSHDPFPCSNDSFLAFLDEKSCAVTRDPSLGFGMGPVLNLSNQQVSTHQFDPMANNNMFGNQTSEGLTEAGFNIYPDLDQERPHPACASATRLSSETVTRKNTQQSVAGELGNVDLRSNVTIPPSPNIVSLMRGIQGSTGNFDPPEKMFSNLLWPDYPSSQSAQLSNEIRLAGDRQVLRQHSQKLHQPERTVSAAASGEGVSAADRVELAQDTDDVGRRFLKRGSDQCPSSVMFGQLKKRATEHEFVHPPLYSSTQSSPGQNLFDTRFPTCASRFSTPNLLNASPNASTSPSLMPDAEMSSLWSTSPGILAQSKKGVIQRQFVNSPYSSTQSLPEQNSFEKVFPTVCYPFNTPNLIKASPTPSTLPLMPAQTHLPSPRRTTPAMFSQCKKGVSQQQFVRPPYPSAQSLLVHNSSEKTCPTDSTTPNNFSNLVHASVTASAPSIMPQYVASETQMLPIWSTAPAISQLVNGTPSTSYANTYQPQLPSLAPVRSLPKVLRNTHPTSLNISNSSSSISSSPNIISQAPIVAPISSDAQNSALQNALGRFVPGATGPAERSYAPVSSLKFSTSTVASGRKPAKFAPRKKPSGKLKPTPGPNQSTPAPKKPASSARALALQRLSSAYTTTSSSLHIKWQGFDEPGMMSGFNCRICKRDLAFSPEGPVSVPAVLPEVAVLACGHTFHDQCLMAITPQDQSSNPPCIPCALGD